MSNSAAGESRPPAHFAKIGAITTAVLIASLMGVVTYWRWVVLDVYYENPQAVEHNKRIVEYITVRNDSMSRVENVQADFNIVAPNGSLSCSGNNEQHTDPTKPPSVYVHGDGHVTFNASNNSQGVCRVIATSDALGSNAAMTLCILGLHDGAGRISSLKVTHDGARVRNVDERLFFNKEEYAPIIYSSLGILALAIVYGVMYLGLRQGSKNENELRETIGERDKGIERLDRKLETYKAKNEDLDKKLYAARIPEKMPAELNRLIELIGGGQTTETEAGEEEDEDG